MNKNKYLRKIIPFGLIFFTRYFYDNKAKQKLQQNKAEKEENGQTKRN